MNLDGKKISHAIREQLKDKISALALEKKPTLAIVLIGDNPASHIYVRNKIKTASLVGIETQWIQLPDDIEEKRLLEIIERLNKNSDINGIIVQLPLPEHLDEQVIINAIDNEKDVDGFGLTNKGMLFSGLPCLKPATPAGIISLLKAYDIELSGKHVVIVGRSNIVGKPAAIMCLNENATVSIAHSKTNDLKKITSQADILIVAVGKAKLITADMVKDGAVVIDVGTNRVNDKLLGDVDFEQVASKASFITPVPGGVGPMTIISLLENTLTATLLQNKKVIEK